MNRPVPMMVAMIVLAGCAAWQEEERPVGPATGAWDPFDGGAHPNFQPDVKRRRIRRRLDRARLLYDRGRYDECAKVCRQVLDDSPAEPEATRLMGLAKAALSGDSVGDRGARVGREWHGPR